MAQHEYWRKALIDESYDWSWSDGAYDYDVDEYLYSDPFPDETQEWTTSQYGNVMPNPLYNEGFGGEASFLNVSESSWDEDEEYEGYLMRDYEEEFGEKSWSEYAKDWLGIGAEGAKILGQLGQGIKTFTQGQKAGGGGLTGVRSKYREPKIKGGGPTTMTKAQATENAVARLNAAAGSGRGRRASDIMRNTNARVNRDNNLGEIISAALGGRGSSGQTKAQTLALNKRLRQMQIQKTA